MTSNAKKLFLLGAFAIIVLSLSSCSTTVGDTTLEGANVLWAPFVGIWQWLWFSFTPGFWDFVWQVWDLPFAVSWLAGPIVVGLGLLLYLAIAAVIVAIDIVLAILIGIVWFILALVNGIFHFF